MAKKPLIKETVRLALFNKHSKLLLARQRKRRLWHLIGGERELSEKPKESVIREALEEANITCENVRLLFTLRIEHADCIEKIYCFQGFAAHTDTMKPDGVEIDALGWAAEENLLKFKLTDTTKLLLSNPLLGSLFTNH